MLGAAFLAGCTGMPGKENVQGFADALKAAVEQFDRAVTALANVELSSKVEQVTADLSTSRRQLGAKFLVPRPPEAMTPAAEATRKGLGDLLQVLSEYSTALTALVGGADLEAAKVSTNAAKAQALVVINGLAEENNSWIKLDKASATQAVGVITTLTNIVMELVVADTVQKSVAKANPQIQAIVDFISTKIIGEAPKTDGLGGSGMAGAIYAISRQASDNRFSGLNELALDPRVDAATMDTKYREAIEAHRAWEALRQVPEALRNALQKMAKAHAALVKPETAGATLDDFRLAVDRLIALYQAAKKPS